MAASALVLTPGTVPSTPASGKGKFYGNSSKNPSWVDDTGRAVDLVAGPANYQATPADPTLTNSTTGLMMGLAGAITPAFSGVVLMIISGSIANSVSGDGAKVQIRYGTGTAPVNGAILVGTTVGNIPTFTAAANGQKAPFCIQAIVSGLTLGTALWIDASLAAITGGNATITALSISAHEI